jgi:hypothetical protein
MVNDNEVWLSFEEAKETVNVSSLVRGEVCSCEIGVNAL